MTWIFEGLVRRLDYVYTANMTIDDNTVNIEDAKARYHQGDLRAALIEEGLRELAGGAAGDLSLRAIARKVGVSATAVYRHFPDKTALLAALCTEGDRLLGDASRRAQASAGGGRAGFDAERAVVTQIVEAAGPRIKVAGDVLDYVDFFLPDEQLPYEPKAIEKHLKKEPGSGWIGELRQMVAWAERAGVESFAILPRTALTCERRLGLG